MFAVLVSICLMTVAYCFDYSWPYYEESLPPVTLGNIVTAMKLREHYSSLSNRFVQFFPPNQPATQFFAIRRLADGATQELVVTKAIDREKFCSSQVTNLCTCTAYQCGIDIDFLVQPFAPSMVSFTIRINISDVNDNDPRFTSANYSVSFLESDPIGTSRSLPSAIDVDFRENSKINYLLSPPSDYFALAEDSSKSIHLILKQRLDREHLAKHRFSIFAIDEGIPPRTGTLAVSVFVSDENDNNPICAMETTFFTVPENLPFGAHVANVTAVDKDSGRNGDISYSLKPGSATAIESTLAINSVTGVIWNKGNIDRETLPIMNLTVIATDNGSARRTAECRVNIAVTDVNDHSPEIFVDSSVLQGFATIKENRDPRTVVTTFSVTDTDEGANGSVACDLTDRSSFDITKLFDGAKKVFQVVSNIPFDREAQSEYKITIQCHDFGNPELTSIQPIVVRIEDVNDQRPEITQRVRELSVTENNKIDSLLTSVIASDKDIGDNGRVAYALAKTQLSELFRVESISGNVYLNVSLDREHYEHITLMVIARDHGVPQLEATATIYLTVMDQNDVAPVIQTEYNITALENQPEGVIGHISATDPDQGDGGHVSIYGGITDYFFVNTSGDVISLRKLDREQRTFHTFMIYAVDGGSPRLTTSATVNIRVQDQNDHAPSFVFPTEKSINVSISFRENEGYLILHVQARDDLDSRENAQISYTLNSAPQFLQIDRLTGKLFLSRTLSESDMGTYTLWCEANDGGDVTHATKVAVYVSVVDVPAKSVSSSKSTSTQLSNFIIVVIVSIIGILMIAMLIACIVFVLIRRNILRLCTCCSVSSPRPKCCSGKPHSFSSSTVGLHTTEDPRIHHRSPNMSKSSLHISAYQKSVNDVDTESGQSCGHGSHDSGRGESVLEHRISPSSVFLDTCNRGFNLDSNKNAKRAGINGSGKLQPFMSRNLSEADEYTGKQYTRSTVQRQIDIDADSNSLTVRSSPRTLNEEGVQISIV